MTETTFRLVAVAEAVCAALSRGSGDVFGAVRPTEGLIQVLAAEPMLGLSIVGRVEEMRSKEAATTFAVDEHEYVFLPASGVPHSDTVEIIRLGDEMDSRRTGVLGERALASARVVLIGAGSVGSSIGLELAKAGVGAFRVIDRDVLDAANLSRHACDLRDLGRPKAIALADLLRGRAIRAEAVVTDLTEIGESDWDAMLRDANLVVATTDAPSVQFLANEACLRTGATGLFVGAFERACGGEIFVLRPGVGPCLFCVTGFRAELPDAAKPVERRQAYQAADANQLHAEPGLGADITYVSAVAVTHALAFLAPGRSRDGVLDVDCPLTLVHGGSQPRGDFAGLFRSPFEVIRARPRRDEPCPVCGWASRRAEGVAS